MHSTTPDTPARASVSGTWQMGRACRRVPSSPFVHDIALPVFSSTTSSITQTSPLTSSSSRFLFLVFLLVPLFFLIHLLQCLHTYFLFFLFSIPHPCHPIPFSYHLLSSKLHSSDIPSFSISVSLFLLKLMMKIVDIHSTGTK